MELYVAATPQNPPPPGQYTHIWAACCTGAHLRVCKAAPHEEYLMVLRGDAVSDPENLAQELLRYCLAGAHTGAVLDFPPGQRELAQLIHRMNALFVPYNIPLAVPEDYAIGQQPVIISASLSGGNLRSHLQGAVTRYGAGRILLDLERTCRDYPLPCSSGAGCYLSREVFERLSGGCTRYFSPELCQRYFTYRCGIQSHFVVYDDADTLRRKMAVAEELGIHKAMVVYGEVADLWPL